MVSTILVLFTLNHGTLTPNFGLMCPGWYKAMGGSLPLLEDLLNVYDIPELTNEPVKPAEPGERDDVSDEELTHYNEERTAYKASMREYKALKQKIKCNETILTWYLDE